MLLLTNARFESVNRLLALLHQAGFAAEAPRNLAGTNFACETSNAYTVFAEMHTCSRARFFLGSPKSSFSHHIVAMRRDAWAAGEQSGGLVEVQWMGIEQAVKPRGRGRRRGRGGGSHKWKDVIQQHLLHGGAGRG